MSAITKPASTRRSTNSPKRASGTSRSIACWRWPVTAERRTLKSQIEHARNDESVGKARRHVQHQSAADVGDRRRRAAISEPRLDDGLAAVAARPSERDAEGT